MSRFNYEWLSRALVVFFAFIPFFAVRELRRVLGEGVIRKFFFERRSATEAGCDPPLMSNHELATGDRRSTSTWFMALAVLTLVLSLGLQVASEFAPDADSERPARLRPFLLSLVADARAAEGNAQETELAAGETELAKESQNPVADLISLPLQYNLGFNVGPYDRAQSVLNIQPVIPLRLTGDWNLITRTILPLIKQPVLTPEVTQVQTPAGVQTSVTYPDESDSGMGDLNLSLFLSPAKPGKLIWGIGPALSFPTASEEQLGTEKFSLGPTGVVLAMQGPWVFGGLISQIWSVTGDENRRSVSQMLIQPFLNYNFKGGWYLSSSPIITANWMAHGNNRWIVPLGGGGGKVFMVGKQPVNAGLQAFYHVARPDFGPEWSLRFQVTLLFPYKK